VVTILDRKIYATTANSASQKNAGVWWFASFLLFLNLINGGLISRAGETRTFRKRVPLYTILSFLLCFEKLKIESFFF